MSGEKRKQEERIAEAIYGEEIKEKEDYEQIVEDMLTVLPMVEEEYLVSGAYLTCSMATPLSKTVEGICFQTKNKGKSQLAVTGEGSIGGKANATVADYRKNQNIFPFGNCKAELTGLDKARLKADARARREGMCSCLMELNVPWDNLPVTGENGYFEYGGKPGINRMSHLLCAKKGWITALTSGQGYSSHKGGENPRAITKEDMLFALDYGLHGKQLNALLDIREYMEEYLELKENPVVFAFEGLGSYSGGTNSCHQEGQYGAMFIVCKEGKMTYAVQDCSTLPDRRNNAVIHDGVYNAVYKKHNGGYRALQLRRWEKEDDGNIPARRYDGDKSNKASGINLHMAKNLHETSGWSLGCLTVESSQYYDFAVAAGFIEPQTDGKDYHDYKNVQGITDASKQYTHWGCVVVDRRYMEEEERARYFDEDEEAAE